MGIKLPHYSGSQYNLGRKIPSSQMRRGDVIFYGPGGSQHVTIYLGDGQMLEAPDIGLKVRVAPVRTSGMTPTWSDTSNGDPVRTEREVMRRKRFRLINFAWITTVVTGLMLSVAGPAPVAAADPGAWDPTLPAQISAGAPGDPLAVANASLQATAQATQTTFNLGKQFLGGLGISIGRDPAPSAATPQPGGKIPRVYGRQAIEYVIKRMGSQMGVPYSWGGGSLDGPSKGVGDGANITGFDCSGLMRYGFAGVGVLIPRFSVTSTTPGATSRRIRPGAGT